MHADKADKGALASVRVRPGSGPMGVRGVGAAELALATLVVGIVTMMIVPLPTWLLDVLLAGNLSLSVAILLVVLYVPDALAIATFPTLLLLTTLFRLALNVSSSRLILLQANAGEVIKAFGGFVVRGNYVVGGVVFLILTVIQFVVIAKGSERVAEVGARFVLDAMPGKQMAIDAEVRAGTLDAHAARLRRRLLSRESQFYGSMDGAMKFVKGDVIASLVITVINILGGLAIGVGQKGMPVVDALKRYGLLTIGDGLVSQIPALVLSTAAGVLVTRVASEEPDTPLGEELAGQLFGQPKALQVAAAFVLLLAVVPGLPALPFLFIAVALVVVARLRTRQLAKHESEDTSLSSSRHDLEFVPIVAPWGIELSRDLASLLDDDEGAGRKSVARASLALRARLFADLGVPLRSPRLRTSPSLPPKSAVISLFEVPARVVSIPAGASESAALDLIMSSAAELLLARGADFLGLSETQSLLDELERAAPATVRNVVPKPVGLALLTDVLRRLVEERVSIRDLRGVLEALATLANTEKDPLNLAELVRAQLRRPLTFRLTRGANHLGVVLVDPMIEDTVRRAITRTSSGAFLTLPPAMSRDLLTALRRACAEASAQSPHAPALAVVLTQPDIRRFVRKILESELPDVAVVSVAELLPEVVIRPLARANLAGIG